MAYLITKMLLCLLLAALLGLFIGWQLRGLVLNNRQRAQQEVLDDCQQHLQQVERERDQLYIRAERLEAANHDLNAQLMDTPPPPAPLANDPAKELDTIVARLQALEQTNQLLQSRIDNLDLRAGSHPLAEIGNLGTEEIEMFRRLGIETTIQLLEHVADGAGRDDLIARTGLEAAELDRMTQVADLLRVPGIDSATANLLQASGIRSVADLADKKANRLALKLKRVNAEKQLLSTAPKASIVGHWIDAATTMIQRESA